MADCRLCGTALINVRGKSPLQYKPVLCGGCERKEERQLTEEAIAAAGRRLKELEG